MQTFYSPMSSQLAGEIATPPQISGQAPGNIGQCGTFTATATLMSTGNGPTLYYLAFSNLQGGQGLGYVVAFDVWISSPSQPNQAPMYLGRVLKTHMDLGYVALEPGFYVVTLRASNMPLQGVCYLAGMNVPAQQQVGQLNQISAQAPGNLGQCGTMTATAKPMSTGVGPKLYDLYFSNLQGGQGLNYVLAFDVWISSPSQPNQPPVYLGLVDKNNLHLPYVSIAPGFYVVTLRGTNMPLQGICYLGGLTIAA
jgi:hypothetical protein